MYGEDILKHIAGNTVVDLAGPPKPAYSLSTAVWADAYLWGDSGKPENIACCDVRNGFLKPKLLASSCEAMLLPEDCMLWQSLFFQEYHCGYCRIALTAFRKKASALFSRLGD